MPCGKGMTRSRLAVSPPPDAMAWVGVDGEIMMIGAPRSTRPAIATRVISNPSLTTTTGVMRFFPAAAIRLRSSSSNTAPPLTAAPISTRGVKPRPSRATVSSPTWMITCAPFARPRVTECALGAIAITVASHGAQIRLSSGSMAKPSPSIRSANTGSGTLSKADNQPRHGADSVTCVIVSEARSTGSPKAGRGHWRYR